MYIIMFPPNNNINISRKLLHSSFFFFLLFFIVIGNNYPSLKSLKIERMTKRKNEKKEFYYVICPPPHSHNGGGSFKSIGNPRLTIPKYIAAAEAVSPSFSFAGATPVTGGGPTCRNSVIISLRPEGEVQR